MAPEPNRRPQYAEEDTRLTSTKEIAGFYAYGWAAEVFVVCGIGSFIPITLEQLARERGVLLTDKTTPCHASFTVPSPPALDYSSVPPLSTYHPAAEAQQCVVYILGVEINTASFALYTFSISVLIQSLLIISMSAAADHGHFRKMFLLTFAFTGAIATILFLSVIPKVYIFGAFLAIVANTCFGASFVLLNSFLPLLVRHHPTVQFEASFDSEPEEVSYIAEATEDQPLLADESIVNSTAALSSEGRPGPDLTTPNPRSPMTPSKATQLSTKISSYGIGIGYIAALIVQTLAIVILLYTGSTVFSLRLVLSLIGAWWFIFTLPAASWLRPRPGPPLRFGDKQSKGRICFAYFTYSWRSLAKTVMKARRLKDMVLFLAAWFLLSDGIATVSGTAVLFAKTTLQMKPAALALINVIATLSGVLGAFTWSRISLFLGLQPSQTILACICLFEVIPFYGLLGYIPAIQRLGVLGLQQPWEMYPLGAVYGFVLGGLSSYCRSMYGDLIPPGFEAAFYALYAITDKGSSVFGPAIVGAITDAYGEIRPAFWFLAILIGLPFPLMLMVDGERGKREATLLAEELSGRNTHQTVIEREEESHNEVFASSGTDSDFDRR
ncbi:autophagy-related protein 22-1 [Patellaria atrata CBS 101060]|uniref:Autophagy-related protein n=1 Tax=Patellaria atrata CBS 101060 TaxID=1346257 RepID=A0A9P4S6F1_9PEZI|nr:autophagy-related protein 22-1 [Patellaria atrata CBS 101060]